MLPNKSTPSLQTPHQHQTVLRQPVFYIALPTNNKPPIHTCISLGQTTTVTNATNNDNINAHTNDLSRGQVCTCPPEVHKAILDNQLGQQQLQFVDGEARPVPVQLGLLNVRAILPTQPKVQLANAAGQTSLLTAGNALRLGTADSSNRIGSVIRLPSGAHWILVPTSSLGATASTGICPHAAVFPSAPVTTSTSSIGTVLHSQSSADNEFQVGRETKPPPDVLLTSTHNLSTTEKSRTQSPVSEPRVGLSCMEGQLAHLSAWVQVLQQSPGAQVQAKHLAGYSHRNCANNACRATADGSSLIDRESNYTPSNSSLDSAYSARSTTSSESVTTKQPIDADNMQSAVEHVPVHVPPDVADAQQFILQLSNNRIHQVHQKQQQLLQHQQTSDHSNAQPHWTSADYCHMIASPNCSAVIDRSESIGLTVNNVQAVKHRLGSTKSELATLKSEIAILRRAQTACMMQHKEATENVLEKVKRMIASVDGLDLGLIQKARLTLNRQLDVYEREAKRASAWLKDLDSVIEDLRMVTLTRRCRISVSEVDMLALHLNRISFRLRNFKNELPKINERLQSLIDAEMRQINRNREFLNGEAARIEEALNQCKQLTSTLFTLKRLGSVQENSTSENIPTIRTVGEPTVDERQNVFDRIVAIQPDHEARVNSIRTFEELRSFRELIKDPDVTRSFENELIFPDETFTFTDTPSSSPEPAISNFAPGENRSVISSCLLPCLDGILDLTEFPISTNCDSDDGRHNLLNRNFPSYPLEQRRREFRHYRSNIDQHENVNANDTVTVSDGYLGDKYMGANEFAEDSYDINFAIHSNEDMIHTEPISVTQDPLVSLASLPKSKFQESPGSSQNDISFRSSRKTVESNGMTAPTILKRVPSSLSSDTCMKQQSGTRLHQSVPVRRSRVVFSRTVLVGNGSETVQLNCPSETDDEDDRHRQVYPTTGNFSVDDLIINRTSQPWTSTCRPDGTDTRELYNPRSTKLRTKTATPRMYRQPLNGPLYQTYQDRIGTVMLPGPVINSGSSSANGSHSNHHHNCQAARQALKIVTTGSKVATRDTM